MLDPTALLMQGFFLRVVCGCYSVKTAGCFAGDV